MRVSESATAFSLTCAADPDSGTAITLPLRIVQANATAAAEQLCAAPIRVSVGSRTKRAAIAPEGRISHHWHAMLLAPGQQVALNATVAQAVGDLVGRAAISVGNFEKIFHLADAKVGYPPWPKSFRRRADFRSLPPFCRIACSKPASA